MKLRRNTLLVFAILTACTYLQAQHYNATTKSVIWDLGPDDPQIKIQFGTKGINIGGYEDVAPVITNNFANELLVKVEFNITDHCGETKVYTTNSKTLAANERWAPSPFFEGYSFNTACKQFAEFGPANDKTKTRIRYIRHRVVTLRNLTQEKKAAEEEKIRKEKELALKRQQEEEAKRKAAEMRKAEEARKAEERKKEEEARKAQEAKRLAEETQRQTVAQQNQQTARTPSGAAGSTARTPEGNSASTAQSQLARQQEAQRIEAEERAAAEASQKAADEAHNRALYERQMAELQRQEYERRKEAERQQALEAKRIVYMQHARATQEAAEVVEDLQQLNLNHSNVAEMEREYARRMAELNVAMNNLEQAKQQEWTSAVQSRDWGTESYSEAMGEFVQTTGAFVQSLSEEKRRREARESLAWQREQFLLKVEAEKAQMRFNVRAEMLKNFPSFQIPETASTGPTRIYGFYVLHTYSGLSAEHAQITVSNVSEIGTYADGTWPSLLHFHTVEAGHKKETPDSYFHSNGYTTRAEAEQMRQALTALFSKNGTVSETYIDATINPEHERMDFWETGILPAR